MINERVRWTDDRLDDAFTDVRADVASHETAIAKIQSDELARLRTRVDNAESSARSDRSATRAVRLAISLAVLGAVGGPITTLIITHVI